MKLAFICSIIFLSILKKVICNQRPILGILATPTISFSVKSHIPRELVTFFEQVGAKIIPIPFDISNENLDIILNKINGVVYPGGNPDLWAEAEQLQFILLSVKIMEKAIEFNENSNFFPIFGMCLGFEFQSLFHFVQKTIPKNYKTYRDLYTSIYTEVDGEFQKSQILFTKSIKKSIIFKGLWKKIQKIQTKNKKENMFFFNHDFGITWETYSKYEEMNKHWKVTSFAKDRKGIKFIASLEHRNYPFYGVQFHPEKTQFVWEKNKTEKEDVIPHSLHEIQNSFTIAFNLIKLSRRNKNQLENYDKFTIENYPLNKAMSKDTEWYYIIEKRNFAEKESEIQMNSFNQKFKINLIFLIFFVLHINY